MTKLTAETGEAPSKSEMDIQWNSLVERTFRSLKERAQLKPLSEHLEKQSIEDFESARAQMSKMLDGGYNPWWRDNQP